VPYITLPMPLTSQLVCMFGTLLLLLASHLLCAVLSFSLQARDGP
jgi:hypothetical protein